MSKKTPKPTDSELEILRILWKEGPATVREVNEKLNQQRNVGYTTTLKLLQIMHEKGFVSREMKGRSHIYEASIDEKRTQEQILNKLVNGVFGGSASKLVMRALGNHKPSKEEIEEIKKLLNQIDNEQS